MSTPTHLLFESALGYGLFEVSFSEDIASASKSFQDSIADPARFGRLVQLKSFAPFKDAAHALENANDVSEGVVNEHLATLLELNLPPKKASVILGLSDRTLASSLKGHPTLKLSCETSARSLDLLRGIRLHNELLLPGLQQGDVRQSQLGLGHAYSRAKVKFNVNRSDNMIIQAIALLDQLDKDVNTFSMRVREWYGWHFPELVKIVPDNALYAKTVKFIGDKTTLSEDKLPELTEILGDNDILARNVLDASRASMGMDISPVDLINIMHFSQRVIELFEYRSSLQNYLAEKMSLVAPNLGALIGDTVAARLISHAGSLTNLSKYPASTVQILGAEKALFRALKQKANTPKYGLIYHSTFIGRAGQKNKGRISRFLANKCSIASRIDCFSEISSSAFGTALRSQVEERLAFYETGSAPTKNSEAMAKVLAAIRSEEEDGDEVMVDGQGNKVAGGEVELEEGEKKKKKKDKKGKEGKGKKRKSEAMEVDEDEDTPTVGDTPSAPLSAAPPGGVAGARDAVDESAKKKKKKAKKSMDAEAVVDSTPAKAIADPAEVQPVSEAKKEKKEKKKKRKSEVAMDES